MKARLIALSMVAISVQLLADPVPAEQINASSGCDCCSPCCNSPTPDPCVQSVCFAPQWYNMECACGFYLSGDFLYWVGTESDIDYAAIVETSPLGTASNGGTDLFLINPSSFACIGTRWQPGFRATIGLNTDCDGRDLSFSWTYYRTDKSSKKSFESPDTNFPPNGNFALMNQWTNNTASAIRVFNYISGHWDFKFNDFDFIWGRRYWLSKCFTLRPFGGVRGIWAKTHFRTKSIRENFGTLEEHYSESDRFTNRTWGVGLIGGLAPTFYFTRCLSLFASSDIALAWGRHKVRKQEIYLGNPGLTGAVDPSSALNGSSQFSSECSYLTPILDVAIGLRFENFFCDNSYHWEFDLGWEHHTLFHVNHRYQTTSMGTARLASTQQAFGALQAWETLHDVSFGGLTVRVRLDF